MGRGFPTTRWSVVLGAAQHDGTPRKALHELCESYWQPLFAYLRRSGLPAADAEDTVQGFLSSLLASKGIGGVEQGRGRFRSYLLGALRNFVSKQRTHDRAAKRGGGQPIVALDVDEAIEIPDNRTPDDAFMYAWAVALLTRTRRRLAQQYEDQGQREAFAALRPFLVSGDTPAYREVAATLGTTPGAARVAVHRLRTRFRAVLREEVADTVGSEAEIDDELRAVIEAVS